MSRPSPKTPPAARPPLAATALALLDACRDRTSLTIYAAASQADARVLADLLRALQPGLALAWYPPWDTLPYDRLAPSAAAMGHRMGVLRWLTDAASPPRLMVTTAEALIARVPPRSIWPAAHLAFAVGDAIDPADVRERLLAVGYLEDDLVDQPGECAVRGQVVDIFPAAAPLPCRIVFEDGRIQGIRSYHPLTQHSEAETQELVVDPASETIGDAEAETVFAYAPEARLILDPDCAARAAAMFDQIHEAAASRSLAAQARRYVDRELWGECLSRHAEPGGLTLPRHQPVPAFARMKNAGRDFDRFVLSRHEAGDRIVVAGPRQSQDSLLRRIRRLLPKPVEAAADWEAVRAAKGDAILRLDAPLVAGLVLDDHDVTLLAAADLLGSRAAATATAAAAPAFIDTELRIGDVVVHRDHGLAVLEALDSVEVPGEGSQDFIRLRYADDARQMLPAGDIGLLWRYGSEPDAVTLDRLDRDSWARRRDKVVADIARTATSLVALARERQAREAPVVAPPADLYERFSARFPFTLTPDQAAAIDAVLADLGSGRPMDRLVCGDVGYGKTEIAVRAAFKAVQEGKQVAVLVPTTLLVTQHLSTFSERMSGFPVVLKGLSRFQTDAEAREVIAELAEGTVDIVVGTHRLLNPDIRMKDLGLIIVDEEQRFGVEHKEQMKRLRTSVDVLSMSATPIPRTLEMAITGIREMSTITTPPEERHPVLTYVGAYEDRQVVAAVRRELLREGQVFYIHNRVNSIEKAAAKIQELVPEARVAIAHGQMGEHQLEQVMLDFWEKRFDVLVCTTIVESGLDVSNANTMIIERADTLGLSQLHQLRGRVGRSRERAYAYFLYP
ncbi:MAG: transcription-repair coupling factor, partial [Hyphomicrobiales bacterium]|nr:transcription-repair coupling factor [Hyphomicrobiales bacterium]